MSLKNIYTLCFSIITLSTIASSGLVFRPSPQCNTDNLDPCTTIPSERSVFCENIKDMSIFLQVIRCGHQKNLKEMIIEKSTLDYLPLFVLDYCGFFFLNVRSVVLSKLLEGNVMVRLQQLHLDRVIVRGSWTWEPLAVLRRLLRFSVSHMAIPTLDHTLVEFLNEKLHKLVLTSTNTTSMSDTALQKFNDMEFVSVQDNEIAELKRSMFPNPAKIKYFFFGKNKLTSLPDDLFENMPDLKQIGLQGNQIALIHDRTFRGIWNNLTHLLLMGNPLKCHCKMLWLVKRGAPAEFTGSCLSPKHQYGKELKSLTISDFQCF